VGRSSETLLLGIILSLARQKEGIEVVALLKTKGLQIKFPIGFNLHAYEINKLSAYKLFGNLYLQCEYLEFLLLQSAFWSAAFQTGSLLRSCPIILSWFPYLGKYHRVILPTI
jgi:hypothetical protein